MCLAWSTPLESVMLDSSVLVDPTPLVLPPLMQLEDHAQQVLTAQQELVWPSTAQQEPTPMLTSNQIVLHAQRATTVRLAATA